MTTPVYDFELAAVNVGMGVEVKGVVPVSVIVVPAVFAKLVPFIAIVAGIFLAAVEGTTDVTVGEAAVAV